MLLYISVDDNRILKNNCLLGSSSDFSEIFLPLLAVMQDLVDSDVLSPSLTLVSLLFCLDLEIFVRL